MSRPFLLTIPHSGEEIPPEAPWLEGLTEAQVMRDVDRFVDQLYKPAIAELKLQSVIAPWHRYAGDLNRLSDDVDASSVKGHPNPEGTHPRGFHWVVTTFGEKLITSPMDRSTHESLIERIYNPFHSEVKNLSAALKDRFGVCYHIDAHSMPSVGTSMHADPGERRAEIVVSDQNGKSARPEFMKLVMESYLEAGFEVRANYPYVGGRITQVYGKPHESHHTVQVEMNRAIYMNEETKRLSPSHKKVQEQLTKALQLVLEGLKGLS